MTTRVIGIGNPLRGDDGFGCAVIARLVADGLPDQIDALDAGLAGVGLVDLMAEAERVVLVDAADMQAPAGRLAVFDLADAHVASDAPGDFLHEVRAGAAIRLAAALGMLPQTVWVVAVQPGQTDWGAPLSPEVARALPRAVDAVKALAFGQHSDEE